MTQLIANTIAALLIRSGARAAIVPTLGLGAQLVTDDAPPGPTPTPPTFAVAPVASGLFDWGSTLSVTSGTVTGDGPITLAYQVQRLDPSGPTWSDVAGETAASYTVAAEADFPGGVRWKVTATNAAGSAVAYSNAISSPIAAAIAVAPALAWWVRDRGIDTAIGEPIEAWRCHNKAALDWTTTATSVRPLRTAGGVYFDGTDDHFRGGEPIGEILDDVATQLIGFDDVDVSAATTARTMFCAASNDSGTNTNQWSINYSRPDAPNASRQRFYIHGGSLSATVDLRDLSSLSADGYDLALRSQGRGVTNGTRVDRLITPLTQIGASVTRPSSVLVDYEYASLGARAVGIGPTISQYWMGTVRYLAVGSVHLSDAQVEAIRDALDAAGYLA